MFSLFISKDSLWEDWNICDLIFGSCFMVLAVPYLTELYSVKILFLPARALPRSCPKPLLHHHCVLSIPVFPVWGLKA